MYCFLWTDLHTGMLQTALTALCDHYPFLRAGITGKLDYIDKRRFIILFLNNAGLHTFGDWRMLCDFSQRHSHCHTQTLTNDCPLADFTRYQKQIGVKFGGDHKVHDLPRVLRLPGFWHQKAEPFMTRMIFPE